MQCRLDQPNKLNQLFNQSTKLTIQPNQPNYLNQLNLTHNAKPTTIDKHSIEVMHVLHGTSQSFLSREAANTFFVCVSPCESACPMKPLLPLFHRGG